MIPVIISSNGIGLPVRAVEKNAPTMVASANGYGIPVVLSDLGVPRIVYGVGPAPEPLLREQIEGLKDQSTPNGRQSIAPLKVIGVDTLPAGASVSGQQINLTGAGVVLEDWDLSGYRVNVSGAGQTIRNCVWDEPEVATAAHYLIHIEPTAVDFVAEYNTLDGFNGYGGPGTFINMPTSGTGADAKGAVGTRIRFNRFLHPQEDVIKSSGNDTLIEWNYYGPLTNYPPGTPEWSAGLTFSTGDYVLAGGGARLFRSKANGNIGNEPPATLVDDAFWTALDPHGDANTGTAADGDGVTIRRNLIDWTVEQVQGVGTTQAMRIVRNTGSSVLMGPFEFSENIIAGIFDGLYPIATGFIRGHFMTTNYPLGGFASEGGVWYKSIQASNVGNLPSTSPEWWEVTTDINAPGPIVIRDNWVGAGPSGSYFHPSTNDAVDVWENNRDEQSDALIPSPVIREPDGPLTLFILGQSDVAITTESTSHYRHIPPPDVDAENLIFYQRNGSGLNSATLPAITEPKALTNANKGSFNPFIPVLANALHYIAPGQLFVLGEGAEAGTGRDQAMNPALNGPEGRDWVHTTEIVSMMEADGYPVGRLCEFWYGNEVGYLSYWLKALSPFYFGQTADGQRHELGDTYEYNNSGGMRPCAVTIYDYEEPDPTQKGRGMLPRTVPLDVISQLAGAGGRAAGVQEFIDDPRFQALGGKYGPPGVGGHSDETDPIDLFNSGFDYVMPSFLRLMGKPADESFFELKSVESDGSFATFEFKPRNGGRLETRARLMGLEDPVDPHPFWQEFMRIDITRVGGQPFWIVRPGSEGFGTEYQGLIEWSSENEIRITPVEPFQNGDLIHIERGRNFLRNDGVYATPTPDYRVYSHLYTPIEHVPAYSDLTADYPFYGLRVKCDTPPFVIEGVEGGGEIPDDPEVWFTPTGQTYQSPTVVPSNTTRIRHEVQMRIPGATPSVSGTRNIFGMANQSFDVILTTNAGATNTYLNNLKDQDSNDARGEGATGYSLLRDRWVTMAFDADYGAGLYTVTVDGVLMRTMTLSEAAITFPLRQISYLVSNFHVGVEFAYLQTWLTTDGVETDYNRVDATNYNTHPWLNT